MHYLTAIDMAAELASESGENPEYDRALSELLAAMYPVKGWEFYALSERILSDIKHHRLNNKGEA